MDKINYKKYFPISIIINFFDMVYAWIKAVFYAKKIGYRIPELCNIIKWYIIIDPSFDRNISLYLKKRITIIDQGCKKKLEYELKYVQTNQYIFFHQGDMSIEDYMRQNNITLVNFY